MTKLCTVLCSTLAVLMVLAVGTQTIFAAEETQVSAFRSFAPLRIPEIVVPTVVQVTLPTGVDSSAYIYEETTGTFVGTLMRRDSATAPASYQEIEYSADENQWIPAPELTDGRSSTHLDLPNDADSYFVITYPEATTVDTLQFSLAPNSASPEQVTIDYVEADTGVRKPVRVRYSIGTNSVTFPSIQTNSIKVQLRHQQPIRLTDIITNPNGINTQQKTALQFLAKPDQSYVLYAESDRALQIPTTEKIGSLASNPVAVVPVLSPNPRYVENDADSDGVLDSIDNCRNVANPDQLDLDRSGTGDVCEDFDADGITNSLDNCPNDSNRAQTNTDGDEAGDTCDPLDNRITEQYGWLPWLGIALTVGALLYVLWQTMHTPMRPKTPGEVPGSEPSAPDSTKPEN